MTEFSRVAVASRAFSVAAILGLAIAFGDVSTVGVAALVTGIACIASYVSFTTATSSQLVFAAEATLTSVVVVTGLPDSAVVLPYLVVLPLLVGLARGVVGASLVIVCQLAVLVVSTAALGGVGRIQDRIELISPWALTIVGAGLVGAFAKKVGKSPAGTSMDDEKYDSARRLLGQLRTLARRLSSGLDPVTIGSQMLAMAEDSLGRGQAAIFTRTESGLVAPLAYRGTGASEVIDPAEDLVGTCWKTASLAFKSAATPLGPASHLIVLPLRLGTEVVGVLVSRVYEKPDQGRLASLQQPLDEMSLRLATALAFDEVRSLATEDERQRLAREIHDGVAQEVASLGYVIDELCESTNDPATAVGLKELRGELSRVVSDLRLSIFELRTEVGESARLGSAISDYVRKIGARSTMTVHLTLDEAPIRLSPNVETELFRMAQEAITNARKHSHAQNLWVNCSIQPPSATITVRDDGRGISGRREDSYGLRIMQERADRIGASIFVEQLHDTPGKPGTCVTITLGAESLTTAKQIEVAS